VSFLLVSLRKDLTRIRRDPLSVALSALIPLIIALLLRLAFGGGGGDSPTAALLVADNDESLLSGLFVGAFGAGPLEDLIAVEPVEEAEGRRRLDDGDGSALLIIPAGFGENYLDGTPLTLTVVRNPAQTVLPDIVEETVRTFADALVAARRVLGGTLDPVLGLEEGPDDATVAGVATGVNQVMERAAPRFFPPGIAVETILPAEEPPVDYGALFLPGMLFLGLLFVADGMSGDLWREREAGTLRRTRTTAGSAAAFLAGKILAGGVVFVVVGAVGLAAARFLFGLAIPDPATALGWMTLSGMFLLTLLTLIQMLATNRRTAGFLSTALVLPLSMAGGSFFPFEAMPAWLARFGSFTPNGWALLRFKEILAGTAEMVPLLTAGLGLVAVTGVLFVLTLRLTARKATA
jgi:hypothetical protein